MKNFFHLINIQHSFFQVLLIIFFIPGLLKAQTYVSVEEAGSYFEGIPEDLKNQIELALPEKAYARPLKPRKLLVFNLHVNKQRQPLKGHSSIPYANYAIWKMGEKTGAYQTFFSNDTLVFRPDIINRFDALCFNNTGGVLFDDPMLRQSLLDYVYSGKGFIGIHATGATFVQWPEYDQFPEFGRMLGGYESGGHPWKPQEWITLKVEEPDHPLNSYFNFTNFDISDEVFQFTEPYSRDKLRVLLSIDISKTDFSEGRRILPERRADKDLAISWIKDYGRGRVFYSALGDNNHVFWDIRVLHQDLAGIQYALGDLYAPATPNKKLTPSILSQEKLGWRLGMTAYSFKDNTLYETIDHTADLGLLYLGGLNVQKVSDKINKNFDHNLSREELYQVREKFLESEVKLVTYYIHDIPNEEVECRKIFEFGNLMGIETFISEPKPGALDLIEKFCEEYNIKVAIHNHGKDISPQYWNPANLMNLIENRSALIGACGDIGYWVRSGIDPSGAIETLGKRLLSVQMHDLDSRTSEGRDVPWGQGTLHVEQLLRKMMDEGIKPSLIGVEYSRDWGRSMPAVKESIGFFDKTIIQMAN